MFVNSVRVFMRIYISFLLFFISVHSFGKDGLLFSNTILFDDMVDNKIEKSLFIYTNQKEDLFKQSYYYDSSFGNDDGDKRVLAFVRIQLDSKKEYEYQEHYYNCSNKNKFIVAKKFDSDGNFIDSNFNSYKIGDFDFKLDYMLC